MGKRKASRRAMLRGLALGVGAVGAAALAGCGETQIVTEKVIEIVTKEVPVDRVVTQIVEKERIVEKEVPVEVQVEKVVTQIVEKEKIVERIVTAAPAKLKQVTIDVTLPANVPEAAEYFEEVVNKPFMALNPHVTVNGIFPPYGEWRRGVLTRMAANEEPDVFGVGGFELPVYAVRGVLHGLDEFYKRDGAQLADMAFPQGGIFDFDGKRYGLTRTVFVTSMTYNPAMFEENGIAPSEINNRTTWAEFLENSIKLTVDGSGRSPGQSGFDAANVQVYGMAQRHDYLTVVMPWIFQNGGDVTDAKGRNSTWTDPRTVEALQFRNDLVYRHGVSPTPDDADAIRGGLYQGMFTQGRAGMTMSLFGQESVWSKPSEVGFTLEGMANLEQAQTGSSLMPFQMLMGKVTKHPEEAWAWMLFHLTDETSAKGITLQENYGISGNTKYWDQLSPRTFDTHLTDLSPFFDAITNGFGNDIGASIAWREWWGASAKHWQEATRDRITVEEAAKRMQEESQTTLDRAFKNLGLS